jgi:PIN domain nuclease of toxin-antitoxin system
VRLLLDTHVLLWWLSDDVSLSPEAREAIADTNSRIAVSAATAWEIGIKNALGKLVVPDDLEQQLEANDFEPLPITIADSLASGRLPRYHDDPFDRMLVAQAQARNLTLVTRDLRLAEYGVSMLHA